MTKILCPVSSIEAFLEQRGNSYRVKHYKGYESSRGIYETDNIPSSSIPEMGSVGNQSLGINLLNLNTNSDNVWGRRLAWSRLRDLGSRDPGSNPGDPTKLLLNKSFGFSGCVCF